MTTPTNKYISIQSIAYAFLVLLMAVTTGCTLDGITSGDSEISNDITPQDLEVAGRIMGETLADESSGVMSSLNDAMTTFSSDGFTLNEANDNTELLIPLTHDDDSNTGRGFEKNFSYSYDPATGTHCVIFTRTVHDGDFFKSVTDTLKYIFTDINGEFITRPREERDRIETIDFNGVREGNIDTPEKVSLFNRKDDFLIDGISEVTAILSIDGQHNGEGQMEFMNDEGEMVLREYTAQIEFLDIQIDKALVQENESLEQGVTGVLSWDLQIIKTTGGSTVTKNISGTVEMNGDGTALLRFKRFAKIFLINLDDGRVRDNEKEFEGGIKHVNIENSTFTLFNGRVAKLTDASEIDTASDVKTLQAIAENLEAGNDVFAHGKGHVDGDLFIVDYVKFEVEASHTEPDVVVREGEVTEVDVNNNLFVIANDLLVRVTNDTHFDTSGDFQSLQAVADALANNQKVVVRVEAIADNETDADLIALEVRFDIDNSGTQ